MVCNGFVSYCSGGSLAPGGDAPGAEGLVGWLLEHQDIHLPDMSDSDSLSDDLDQFSDTESLSDDMELLVEGASAASPIREVNLHQW